MTALMAAGALLAGWLHYSLAGPLLLPGLSVHVAMFVVVLGTAATRALLSGERSCRLAAAALMLNFAGAHWAWQSPDPLLAGAALDVATAAWFVIRGRAGWELAIGALYTASAGLVIATWLGLIPSHLDRAPVFIAWSYPDLAALIGYMASITLGAGSGDGGKLARMAGRLLSVVSAARLRDSLGRHPVAPRAPAPGRAGMTKPRER